MEHRGGRVTAIDIWDSSVFDGIKRVTGSNATYVQKNLFELDHSFGQFDVVMCGSLLLHVRDIIGAMERMRSVCRGEAIVCTAVHEDDPFSERPIVEFIGQHDETYDYWTYWRPNMAGLGKMLLAAGFAHVEPISVFTLASRPEYGHATLHGVVKAYV
jgi:ubiquinone/menaquinone biosynthesis C-methylase UbiE